MVKPETNLAVPINPLEYLSQRVSRWKMREQPRRPIHRVTMLTKTGQGKNARDRWSASVSKRPVSSYSFRTEIMQTAPSYHHRFTYVYRKFWPKGWT